MRKLDMSEWKLKQLLSAILRSLVSPTPYPKWPLCTVGECGWRSTKEEPESLSSSFSVPVAQRPGPHTSCKCAEPLPLLPLDLWWSLWRCLSLISALLLEIGAGVKVVNVLELLRRERTSRIKVWWRGLATLPITHFSNMEDLSMASLSKPIVSLISTVWASTLWTPLGTNLSSTMQLRAF